MTVYVHNCHYVMYEVDNTCLLPGRKYLAILLENFQKKNISALAKSDRHRCMYMNTIVQIHFDELEPV